MCTREYQRCSAIDFRTSDGISWIALHDPDEGVVINVEYMFNGKADIKRVGSWRVFSPQEGRIINCKHMLMSGLKTWDLKCDAYIGLIHTDYDVGGRITFQLSEEASELPGSCDLPAELRAHAM
jgi:hypothetical protein